MAHTRRMLDKQGYTHYTPTHPGTHTHAGPPAYTQICNTYCFLTAIVTRIMLIIILVNMR